jgi:prephenate dehydrogenase
MKQTRMSIIGVGLLGGSIGLAVKSGAMPAHIIGYGHRPEKLKRAKELGAIDEIAGSCRQAVRDSDLVILCTPVGLFEQVMDEVAGVLSPEAIVTDVGSTKRSVIHLAEKLLPDSSHFVGSHPMAGSEKRGVEFARADLFQGARCILTPTERTSPAATEQVDQFWQKLGMRTSRMSPDEHDRIVCDVSHLPHLLAAALVAMQEPAALPMAGSGFLDTTRIASGDGALWRDILQDNRDNVMDSIRRFREQLDHVQGLLDPAQHEALASWLDDSARIRARLLEGKSTARPDPAS